MVRAIPMTVIASWPPANFDDPLRRGPGLVTLAASLIAVVAILVLLRLYVHMFILRWVSWDDVFIVLAFISVCGMTTCTVVAYKHYGWDRHIWDTPFDKFSKALYLAWWTKIVYSTAACFTRLSLLCFYYRVTQESTKNGFRLCIYASTVISILCGVTLVSLTIFQCRPIRAFWTFPPLENQKCLDDGKLTLGGGITNTVVDLMVIILPIPLILGLELTPRQRVGAIVLVSLGLVVCVAGAVRAYYSWYALIATYDDTWNGFGIYIAATIELDLGVICACAPAVRAFVMKVFLPRIATIVSILSHRASKDIQMHKQPAVESQAPRQNEGSEMGAEYASHLPRINHIQAEKDDPLRVRHFNATRPLHPPPSDAQVLRANFRRADLLIFPRHSFSQVRKSAASLERPFIDLDTTEMTVRKNLTPKIARSPLETRSHRRERDGEEDLLDGSVIDLDDATGSVSTPMSATESIVGGLPSFPLSPTSTVASSKKRSDTLRIPNSTLKLSRESSRGAFRQTGSTGSIRF
ncbi:uncharacterized protein PV09_04535 [Verruconis gallopava]|uniref:Rhodopsin domain-containing protein n=1 Tax=Verruconis gallopava TaxID=253628 RepID=A0A0D2AYI2_9PEZI|nr:uncharacterized protein PV09_04535 [Verruconis gallopava]KIW04229.1 hypothetical protein PV09_04535 [Verruconis gallopava]